MVFRVAQPWGEQLHVFGIEGHRWPQQPEMEDRCEYVSSQIVGPGSTFNAWLFDGAGSEIETTGDFMFYDMRQPFLEAGLWGLLRVLPAGDPSLPELVDPLTTGPGSGTGGSTPARPQANAGFDLFVEQGDTVTLNGLGSRGSIDSVFWRQLWGEPVVLDDPTSMTPSFVAPAGGLLFELEVSGPGGSSVDVVYVEAEPRTQDLLTADATFRTTRSEWIIEGTASITASNQVILLLGDSVVGTANVQSSGAWSFRQRNAPLAALPHQTLRVISSAGGALDGVPIVIRK